MMKKRFLVSALALMFAVATTGCTIVDTGEVGLRVNFDKTIESNELVAGSFNQTVIGKVLTFPIKDVSVDVRDLMPLAADNSTMKDFDITVVYNITPSAVSDLFINKSRALPPDSLAIVSCGRWALMKRMSLRVSSARSPPMSYWRSAPSYLMIS